MSEKAAPTSSPHFRTVDEIPFSILTNLYRDLRHARATRQRSASNNGKQADLRRGTLLSAAWTHIAQLCGRTSQLPSIQHDNRNFVPAHVFPPSESFKLVSLLVPALDSAHAYMGMKESKLADCFIKSLDLDPNGADAQWLRHYKEKDYRPQKWKRDIDIVDGNLPTVLKALLKERCAQESSLTIGCVWNALETLTQTAKRRHRRIAKVFQLPEPSSTSNASVAGRQHDSFQPDVLRANAIRSLVSSGTAEDVSEVSRIVLKDLDIRLNEDSFLNWFHPAAKQHYTQMHDIHKLLSDCHDPKFEIGEACVQIGHYASVMLTMRPSRRKLDLVCKNLLGNGPAEPSSSENADNSYFIMEPKLDGERMQLHKWKAKSQSEDFGGYNIRTFSRRGNDSSAMYAEALTEAVLLAVKAEDVILDGEIMIWDELRASWVRFEDMREVSTSIAKRSVSESASYVLRFMVFDVLYIAQDDSEDARRAASKVIRLPLYQRRELLKKIIQPKEVSFGSGVRTRVELIRMERGSNETELIQALQRYETLGYEGVIAKNPDQPYLLAERNIRVAIKLKPDYFDGGIQDLDCLILGARYSDSRGHRTQRAGSLSSFLIGVRSTELYASSQMHGNEEWEERMKKCKWIPVGSIGTGYSDDELAQLQHRFRGEWKDFHNLDLPEHFEQREYAPSLLAGVAKWIQPWRSVVVTVQAYELNRRLSALRFPRVQRINWEKPYYDVPTFTQLIDLDDNKTPPVVVADENDVDDVLDIGNKKRKRGTLESDEEDAVQRARNEGHIVTGGRSTRKLISSAAGLDVSNVKRKTSAFQNTCFYVVAEDCKSKEELELKIHELGGRFLQSLTSEIDFVICTTPSLPKARRLKHVISSNKNDTQKCSILRRVWVDDCHDRLSRIDIRRSDVVLASQTLAAIVFKFADRFGDYWDRNCDEVSIAESLREVEKWTKETNIDDKDEPLGINEGLPEVSRVCNNVFANTNVFVPPLRIGLAGSKLLLEAYGAQLVEKLDERTEFVLIHSSLRDELEKDNPAIQSKIITEIWVEECIDAGKLLST
ncbi:DNA ligase 4 [Gracilariopsis chorda]|uniref:DNA ligase IV n=1 Tax=Gracilariopsis chorda TaxID=448386 RepID=A0A2V3IVY5_9FLOR|nr:DNA ligase 4 [Gracilariopsis chorda]|eukprot:PXF46308.1 DNA ligase 4 [Gracilariopsis chorda]